MAIERDVEVDVIGDVYISVHLKSNDGAGTTRRRQFGRSVGFKEKDLDNPAVFVARIKKKLADAKREAGLE